MLKERQPTSEQIIANIESILSEDAPVFAKVLSVYLKYLHPYLDRTPAQNLPIPSETKNKVFELITSKPQLLTLFTAVETKLKSYFQGQELIKPAFICIQLRRSGDDTQSPLRKNSDGDIQADFPAHLITEKQLRTYAEHLEREVAFYIFSQVPDSKRVKCQVQLTSRLVLFCTTAGLPMPPSTSTIEYIAPESSDTLH